MANISQWHDVSQEFMRSEHARHVLKLDLGDLGREYLYSAFADAGPELQAVETERFNTVYLFMDDRGSLPQTRQELLSGGKVMGNRLVGEKLLEELGAIASSGGGTHMWLQNYKPCDGHWKDERPIVVAMKCMAVVEYELRGAFFQDRNCGVIVKMPLSWGATSCLEESVAIVARGARCIFATACDGETLVIGKPDREAVGELVDSNLYTMVHNGSVG